MKEILKTIAVLTFTCLLCAFFLAFVHSIAKEKIELNEKAKIENAIMKLAPSTREIEQIEHEGQLVYKLFDSQEALIGYAFIAQGQGYQGTIKILTVIDSSLKILEGFEIIDSVETPGLGARITEDTFCNQFKRLAVSPKIVYTKEKVKEKNEIQAITGATVSSKAVVNILNTGIEILRNRLNQ
ncbi:MAG: FMN-binding protein [Candidatus Omnitrophota bacterium]|nr:MAG: FMN-binding protein [Candidatus Omnitrophota bacterium]